MKDTLEERLQRIREMDAFLAVRLEGLLCLAGVTTVACLALFLWYAVIRGHELWIISVVSILLGILIGVPIGRFFMPLFVGYVRSLILRMESTHPPIPSGRKRSA